MATFQAQVEGLTSLSVSTTPTTTELTTFLTDGAKEIINILPPKLKAKCATRSTLNASATTLDLDSKGDILHITRLSADSGGFEQACRRIPAMYGDLTNDSSSLKFYATVTDPSYFITNNSSGNPTLFVRPNPTNAQPSYVHHITYPTVAFGDSIIANFPDEAEHLVALYAATKTLLANIGALTIPPNVGGSAESLTSSMSAIDGGQIGTDAEFLNFRYWFTVLGEMIEDDEDIELASAQIEKINAYVSTWNIQLQGNLAEMQQYMTLFQTLKGDYNMGIQMLVSGGIPQAQPQRARR